MATLANMRRATVRRQIARRVLFGAAVVSAIVVAGVPEAGAQSDGREPAAAETAAGRAGALMRAGRYEEALPEARTALSDAEVRSGADSAEAAVAAHNLGFVLRRVRQDAEAVAHLERAFVLYEKQLPAVHEDVRNLVGELGTIHLATGRGDDLVAIFERLISRARAQGYADHVGCGHLLANLGFVARQLGRPADAERRLGEAVAVYEKAGAVGGTAYRTTLEGLLDVLDASGKPEEAVARARERADTLVLADDTVLTIARLHGRLSRSAVAAARYGEARTRAEAQAAVADRAYAALGGRRTPDMLDPRVDAFNNLARANRGLADYPAADAAYTRAIALLEAAGDKANAGIVTDNLAVLLFQQGRLDEAEARHKRALALIEEALGREHKSAGQVAANLGAMLNEASRHAEAEPLLRRALAIARAQKQPDPVTIGIIEDNLAGLLRMTGRNEEARGGYERALALFEGALPPTHPRIATARNNVGRFLLDTGRPAEAERQLTVALAQAEVIYGPGSYGIAVPAANLGEAYARLGRRDDARRSYARAIAVLEDSHGTAHGSLVSPLVGAGRVELDGGDAAKAAALFQRAVAIEVAARARRGVASEGARSDLGARAPFLGLIEAQWRVATANGAKPDASVIAASLAVGQWDTMTPAAVALAALGARAGAGEAPLAALTRERQDLTAVWRTADRRLTGLLAETGRSVAVEQDLRQKLVDTEARLTAIDATLAERFPRYGELSRPTPLGVTEIRKVLTADEAAIQFVVAPEATYVWVVTATDARWHRAAIRADELRIIVGALRCGLDEAEWQGEGARRCATRLGREPSQVPAPGTDLPFDPGLAHTLYKVLLAPVAEAIAGKDLLVVASGALTALPLQALVTAPPADDDLRAAGTVAWLGRRHAITMLPSLSSLRPLRELARTSAAARPYLGIGNPLLTGPDGGDRRAFEAAACEIGRPAAGPTTASRAPGRIAPTALLRSATTVALDDLRRQYPLPETVEELCRVASFTGARGEDVIVGANATETEIKGLSMSGRLAEARVVHFATHGLLAGETALFLSAKAEPSLMLTPPQAASEVDDGLLTASEVAGLRLDADWVVLSACNTASGDDIGAEALSGLARAFFYAGARSLLVSHWAVDSEATVRLVTAAFEAMAKEPGLTQAQALRVAMGRQADEGGRWAHPSNWAPFVVVGGSAPAARRAPVVAAPAVPAPPISAAPTRVTPAKAGTVQKPPAPKSAPTATTPAKASSPIGPATTATPAPATLPESFDAAADTAEEAGAQAAASGPVRPATPAKRPSRSKPEDNWEDRVFGR
jgi:CHAT domain-containing protein/tetratricopeptide (TPR) repeat protein